VFIAEDTVDLASSASSPERRSVRAVPPMPEVTLRVFECCDDDRGCTGSGLP
jgi:hypothetical protein